MTLGDLSPGRFINWTLLSEPMNWGIVFAVASLWLLAIHVVMQGWGAMRATPQGAFAPGMISAPVADDTSIFSQPGLLGSNTDSDLDRFLGGGATGESPWGDSIVARFSEDGWAANG